MTSQNEANIIGPTKMNHSDHESRYSEQAITYAEKTRQRKLFRDSPPLCGSSLSFNPTQPDGTTNSEFTFNAEEVEIAAVKAFTARPNATGLKLIANWASLRDDTLTIPTPLPEGADCFELILDDLINAANGQVWCYECDKVYSVAEMQLTHQTRGSWGYNNYRCPSKHSLLLIKAIHFMR